MIRVDHLRRAVGEGAGKRTGLQVAWEAFTGRSAAW